MTPPTEPTPALTRAVARTVRKGVSLEVAAAVNLLDPKVARQWVARGKRGKPGDEAYVKFRVAVGRAHDETMLRVLLVILRAALRKPAAARWVRRWAAESPEQAEFVRKGWERLLEEARKEPRTVRLRIAREPGKSGRRADKRK